MQEDTRTAPQWWPYDWAMDERAETIKQAIDAIVALDDPQTRAKAATEALVILNEANGTLAKLRREDVRAMRAAGLSLRQVGDAIGIHFTRVKQIEDGSPTGNSARGRVRAADDESAD